MLNPTQLRNVWVHIVLLPILHFMAWTYFSNVHIIKPLHFGIIPVFLFSLYVLLPFLCHFNICVGNLWHCCSSWEGFIVVGQFFPCASERQEIAHIANLQLYLNNSWLHFWNFDRQEQPKKTHPTTNPNQPTKKINGVRLGQLCSYSYSNFSNRQHVKQQTLSIILRYRNLKILSGSLYNQGCC